MWQKTDPCHYRVTPGAPDPQGPQDPLARTASLEWMAVTATLESLDPLVSWVLQDLRDPLDLRAPWDRQGPRAKEWVPLYPVSHCGGTLWCHYGHLATVTNVRLPHPAGLVVPVEWGEHMIRCSLRDMSLFSYLWVRKVVWMALLQQLLNSSNSQHTDWLPDTAQDFVCSFLTMSVVHRCMECMWHLSCLFSNCRLTYTVVQYFSLHVYSSLLCTPVLQCVVLDNCCHIYKLEQPCSWSSSLETYRVSACK